MKRCNQVGASENFFQRGLIANINPKQMVVSVFSLRPDILTFDRPDRKTR